MNPKIIFGLLGLYLLGGTLWYFLGGSGQEADVTLLNVSYDPTRELYKEINALFIEHCQKQFGRKVAVKMSHGGSSSQARSIIDGLQADVATLALWNDIDAIRRESQKKGQKPLIADDWESRLPEKPLPHFSLPHQSLPYFSTIVFVVRKGNPKNIKDWPDIIKPGVQIITPNPKTSGNGQLSFLAAWGAALVRGGDDAAAEAFVTQLYKQTPVLDTGARGSSTTFAQKKIGDVHLTWENEAYLEKEEAGGDLEIIYPPASIKAEPFVTVIDGNVKPKGPVQVKVATEYLNFLYTDAAQEIIAKHYYRPSQDVIRAKFYDTIRAKYPGTQPEIELFPITRITGNIPNAWGKAQQRFFSHDGVFDRIYEGKQ